MDIIQRADLTFEIHAWKPKIPVEMIEWFLDNDIEYNEVENRYGSASFHYNLYIDFEKIEDAVAFKLRWS